MKWKISILIPGDHIRVKRTHYFHHGIYIGNNEVIHFTGLNDDGIVNASEVLVRKTSLEFFLKDGVAERAIYTKKELKFLKKPDEIVEIAKFRIGEGNYDLVYNNCEHFVSSVKILDSVKIKNKPHPVRFILRLFVKLTGFIPYIIYAKPRFYYQSKKAKKESKNLKEGAVIVSNHTSIFDYYVLMYKHFGKVLHTMVADVVYKLRGMSFLNGVMENIRINRDDPSNVKAYYEAKKYLDNKKTVLVFPEGHLETNAGNIEPIKSSVIKLAFETNKPILPYYTDGNFGILKRVHVICGEKIDVRKLVGKNTLSSDDIKFVENYLLKIFNKLKHQLDSLKKYKTQELISKKLYIQDFMKITSFPFGYLILRARKIYLGNKKEIKAAVRERVLLAPNHTSMYDVIFMYLYFFSRRLRIIALNHIWNVKILRFAFNRAGVIKYNRESPTGFDMNCFREANGILEGNGAVVIFPQGHISKDGLIDSDLKGGLAALSINTNAPIIPIIFADSTKFFKINRIVIGDVIRPSDYIGDNAKLNKANTEMLNGIIYNKMIELQEKAKLYSRNKAKGGN